MRRRSYIRRALLWTALMGLPLVLSLVLAYALSYAHYRQLALDTAEANARRIADIFERGREILEELERTTGGECNDFSVSEMRRAVFQSVHFREAGIERDGHLVCTSFEMVDGEVDIDNATRPVAAIGRMEVLAPKQTVQGGQSLILNLPLDANRTHFLNLLLDPQVLVEMLDYGVELQPATFLEDGLGGWTPLDSAPMGVLAGVREPPPVGTHRTDDGLYAVVHPEGLPIYTLIGVDHAVIRQHWRTQMQPAVLAGFALSLLGVFLLRRYLPKQDAVDDLREGIRAGEILVWYQPLIDARLGRTVGAEALVRWQHPKRGLVMPDDFIPLAEQTGLIDPMTEALLRRVRDDLVQLGVPHADFRIHVNLASTHLADSRLLRTLDRVFGPNAPLDHLGFEVTERELLANVADQARAVVAELRARGAEIGLDDFGTGYSGLSYLRHLPIHHIKIDRSFVWAINTEAVTASLIDNIVMLAQSLGLGLIAEGVETEAQREKLLLLGANLQQGWLYAKAMPFADFCQHLARERQPAAVPVS